MMATLALTFSSVYVKVSEFLGYGSSPADTNLTQVKDLTYRGYRRFLFPHIPEIGAVYSWSFLRKTAILNTVANIYSYVLPSDFVGLVSGFKFDAAEGKANPKKLTVSNLRALRSDSVATGLPEYYAITRGEFAVDVPADYVVQFYKIPDATYIYKYEYIFEPAKPVADTELFVGGSLAAEVIMECALAAAELQEDDKAGEHEAKASKMLSAFMEYDKRYFPSTDENDPNAMIYIPRFRLMQAMPNVAPKG